jgi:hypothetical protein
VDGVNRDGGRLPMPRFLVEFPMLHERCSDRRWP